MESKMSDVGIFIIDCQLRVYRLITMETFNKDKTYTDKIPFNHVKRRFSSCPRVFQMSTRYVCVESSKEN